MNYLPLWTSNVVYLPLRPSFFISQVDGILLYLSNNWLGVSLFQSLARVNNLFGSVFIQWFPLSNLWSFFACSVSSYIGSSTCAIQGAEFSLVIVGRANNWWKYCSELSLIELACWGFSSCWETSNSSSASMWVNHRFKWYSGHSNLTRTLYLSTLHGVSWKRGLPL